MRPVQAEELAGRSVCAAAGTPARIAKLCDIEALSLDRLELVVLDMQRDAKRRSILDIPETRKDWWELFGGHLSARLRTGETRLALVA